MINWIDIPGETGPTLTKIAEPGDTGQYRRLDTNIAGSTPSNAADVVVKTLHPGTPVIIVVGGGALFPGTTISSTIAGQWYINDVAVPGETGNTFVVPETVLLGDEIRCRNSTALEVVRIPGSWGVRVDTTRTTEKTTGSDQFHMMGRSGVNETITIYWGDGTKSVCDTWDHTDRIHTYADEGVYDVQVVGVTTADFRYTASLSDLPKIVSIDQWGNPWGSNQSGAFWATGSPFKLGELPFDAGTGLNSLVNAPNMFNDQSITSIPDDMTLPLLEVSEWMFRNNNLMKIPDGMVLDNLRAGREMFNTCNLQSLPSGMTLGSLVSGLQMFRFNSNLKTLPLGMSLESLTNGTQMFLFCTLDTDAYSGLLIRMEANNPNDNVVFHGGNSKYNTAAAVARTELVNRGWTITDGGPE